MSLEGSGEALDAVPEVTEITEIPPEDPALPIPEEISQDNSEAFKGALEKVNSIEDLEAVTDVEEEKAGSVLGFAQESLVSAKETTGDTDLFKDEETELKALENELNELEKPETYENISAPTAPSTPQEKADSVTFGHTPLGSVEQPLHVTETIDTISPDASTEKVASPENKEGAPSLIERANSVVYSNEKASSLDEVKAMIAELEALNGTELPGDAAYAKALEVWLQESEYWRVNLPITIENDAKDLDTGQVTSIEVIASEQERSSAVRPTKEALEEAEKTMMSTQRGRVMDMLAYLKDYEAVATGNMESFHSLMPRSRLEALKAKSQFAAPEIVGGLALTWEDTAALYESQGNVVMAEQIRATGKFAEVPTSTGDTIIGEQHLKLINDPEYQQRFENILSTLRPGDTIIVEHPSDPKKNAWSVLSTETRFMQQAESFPNSNPDIALEVMDDPQVSKWEAWEEAEDVTGIDRNEFFFASGMMDASQRFFSDGGLERLFNDIQNNEAISDADKKARILGVQRFIQILESDPKKAQQQMGALAQMQEAFIKLDSTCRERAYQEKVAHVKAANPQGKVVVVIGASHMDGIERALEDPEYRTSVDQDTLNKFKGNLREFES